MRSLARALLAVLVLSGLAACPGGRELPADQKVCKNCYLDWGSSGGDRATIDQLVVVDKRRDQQPAVDQKPCTWDNCNVCPASFCGDTKHAACIAATNKCRCQPGWVGDNPSVFDPVSGCYKEVTSCSVPSACNTCGIGVCGPNADCNQGKCGCNAGYSNCDNDWFLTGCECHGTCGNCT